MNALDELQYRTKQSARHQQITFECFQESQDLIFELIKFCPHNIIEYTYKELDRLHKKYMQEEQFRLQ
jgi:predicted nucleic acid-binding protein